MAWMQSKAPRFIKEIVRDIVSDRVAFRTLIAGSLAIAAVGFDPQILDPGLPSMRSALKLQPELESLLLLGALAQAGVVLAGGGLADALRSERLLSYALVVLALAAAWAALIPSGPGQLASRVLAWVCDGIVLPFAIGSIAMAYRKEARATALGIAYAVFGASTAAAPALILLFGADGPRVQAFVACALVALLAAWLSRRTLPDLPGATREQRPYIAATALWAFGVVAVVAALFQAGGPGLVRWLVVALGLSCVGVSVIVRRRFRHQGTVRVALRPVAVVLAVGIVIGFAQAIPLLQLPVYFQVILGFDPLLAVVAIAPFVLALLAAGPVCGWLLARVTPRTLIAGGTAAIGIADLVFAAVVARNASYFSFVLPFVLVGAGFVIATSVRTAVIFASVPHQLPASAAALNEASVGLGSRIGITTGTLVFTQSTLGAYAGTLAAMPNEIADRLLTTLREILTVIGLPSFGPLIGQLDPSTFAEYAEAAIQGLRASQAIPGLVAIVAAVISYFALGRQDPVRTVWELADERSVG
jgi:MFS family permease